MITFAFLRSTLSLLGATVTLDSFRSLCPNVPSSDTTHPTTVIALPAALAEDPTNLCQFNSMRRLPIRRGTTETIKVRRLPNPEGVVWECRGGICVEIEKPDNYGLLPVKITGVELGDAELVASRAGQPFGKVYIMVKNEDSSVA